MCGLADAASEAISMIEVPLAPLVDILFEQRRERILAGESERFQSQKTLHQRRKY